jgi:hypothetical protein
MNAGFCDEVLSRIFKRFLASLFRHEEFFRVTRSTPPEGVGRDCLASDIFYT